MKLVRNSKIQDWIQLILMAVLVIFTAANLFAQEKKGPKIALEEEEITIIEDGKEIKKTLVSKSGDDRSEIFDEVKQKIFKKLGVTSLIDLNKKKLGRKYNEESRNLVKTKRLEQPKLKFLDAKGNVKKEISLTTEKKNTKIKDKWAKLEWEGETVVRHIPVIVSKNQQFAVAETSRVEQPIPTGEYLKVYEGVGQIITGQITFYDVSGEILFKKDYPIGRYISGGENSNIVLSNTGTMAVITNSGEGPGEEILYVYDKNGNELLILPKEGETSHPEGDMDISPNGRYLSVSGIFQTGGTKVAFFDLENKKSWVADKHYAVISIDDEGIVKAAYQLTSTQLDLKKLIGE